MQTKSNDLLGLGTPSRNNTAVCTDPQLLSLVILGQAHFGLKELNELQQGFPFCYPVFASSGCYFGQVHTQPPSQWLRGTEARDLMPSYLHFIFMQIPFFSTWQSYYHSLRSDRSYGWAYGFVTLHLEMSTCVNIPRPRILLYQFLSL